jgi:hypothetical protein
MKIVRTTVAVLVLMGSTLTIRNADAKPINQGLPTPAAFNCCPVCPPICP